MKKVLFLIPMVIGIFLINPSANAQNVNIPDANFKAYLVGNSAINTNLDGEIQATEATAFTGTIDVTSSTIADLTGIEAFTALTQLKCGDNLLTSLNVSANTTLTTLNCYYNSLTNLDISTNTALTYFDCYDNSLTSLDVSANTALTILYCDGNYLTNLDVSTNTALTYLECTNNSLTSLNIKNGNNTNLISFSAINNPGLTCILVDNAVYMNSNWPSAIDGGASYNDVNLTFSGTINYMGTNADSVNVILYLVNPDSSYQEYATVETDVAGYYEFNSLPEAKYVVKAEPSAVKYPDYLPTYFLFTSGTTYWNQAFIDSLYCGANPLSHNISLIQKVPQTGAWQCNGYIYEYYGYGSRLAENIQGIMVAGEPLPDIDITIDQSPGGSVSSVTTDVNGYFSFTGLNNNVTFVVRVDMPGYPNDSVYTFTVTPGDPALDSLNFYVSADSVFIFPEDIFTGVNVIKSKNLEVSIAPNPTKSTFVLAVTSTRNTVLNINLTNSLGQVVLSNQSNLNTGLNKINFDIHNQPSGLYFMSINYENNHYIKKIIKQ